MSRRRKILLLVWGSLLALIVFLVLRPEPEPYYQGRSLSEWGNQYLETTSIMESYAEAGISEILDPTLKLKTEAEEAIQHIGTNAIPFLFDWIRYEQSETKREWLMRINGPIIWLHNKVQAKGDWYINDHDEERARLASFVFGALRQHAHLVLPELTRLLNDPEMTSAASSAAEALARLGQPGLTPLKAALEGTNEDLQRIVIYRIDSLGTNATPIVPLLLRVLTNSDPRFTAGAVASALGKLKLDPDLVVPALINNLASTNPDIFHASAKALADYGAVARSAIPVLTNFLSNPDAQIRNDALDALHGIDPKRFTGGGPQRFGSFPTPGN